MLFMVIEHFKDCDALPAYRRFRDRGRMLPEGMVFHDSWVEAYPDTVDLYYGPKDSAILVATVEVET